MSKAGTYRGYYYMRHPCIDIGYYCMDGSKHRYLHMDGHMSTLCGESGYWDSVEQLKAFIDAIIERDEIKKGFLNEEEMMI